MEDVHIAGAYTSCGCTSVEITKPALKTYESGSILARLNTDRFLGQRGATITVHFDRPQQATVRLKVSGTIHNDLVVSPSSADLGTVEEGAGAQGKISVRYAGARSLQIVDVKSTNPHVSARIVPSEVSTSRAATWSSNGCKAPPAIQGQPAAGDNKPTVAQIP